MLDPVVEAAEGSVLVHTDTSTGMTVHWGDGRMRIDSGGFKTFGDGVGGGSRLSPYLEGPPHRFGGFRDAAGDRVGAAEVVMFEDVSADRPADPADTVRFGYAFNPELAGPKEMDRLPAYPETKGPRPGNLLVVQAVLPKPVADRLMTMIEDDPLVAREVAERLVLERGGLDRAFWEQGTPPYDHRVKPPYDNLPETHRIHLIIPGADGVVTAQPLTWRAERTGETPGRDAVEKFTQQAGSFAAVDGRSQGTGARPRTARTRDVHGTVRGD